MSASRREGSERPWSSDRLGGYEFPVPSGWEHAAQSTADVSVFTAPEGTGQDSDGHRPSLVATLETCTVTTAQYSTQAMSELMVQLPLLRILDVDLWAPPGLDPTAGRRLEFLHTAPGSLVHVTQYLVVHEGTAFTLTLTCSEQQLTRWDQMSWDLGDRVRVNAATRHDAPEGPRAPVLPRLAEAASVRHGAPLEALSVLAPEQPFRSAGPVLTDEAAGLLLHLAATGEGPASGPDLESSPWAELVSAGLTEPGVGLSAQGTTVTGPLLEPAGRATLTAHRDGRETRMTLFHGAEGQTLLLAQAPVGSIGSDGQGVPHPTPSGTRVDFLPLWRLAETCGSWLGITPAWRTAVERAPVRLEDFDRRVTQQTSSPAGLDAALHAAWAEPWVVWQAEGDGGRATYLHAGEAGHYLVESDGLDHVLLTSVPARNVHRHLTALLAPAGAGFGFREPPQDG